MRTGSAKAQKLDVTFDGYPYPSGASAVSAPPMQAMKGVS